MALISCPECGKELSDATPACPHCGYPLSSVQTVVPTANPSRKRGFVLAAAILATLYTLFAIAFFYNNGIVTPNHHNSDVSLFGMVDSIVSDGAEINMRCFEFGIAFNWIGFIFRKRGLVLTAAILYSFGSAFFPLYLIFTAMPIVFAYIGAHHLKA